MHVTRLKTADNQPLIPEPKKYNYRKIRKHALVKAATCK